MTLTRAQIEALAPDQSALTAAGKLLKPAAWSSLGQDGDGGLIWGECQGSGANPYRVMADLSDLGSKCTCPSRKFPCKHALALMWMRADSTGAFTPGSIPEWVSDWLGRRRKGAGAAAAAPKAGGGASLAEALTEAPEAAPDPEAEAKRAAAAAKRATKTSETVAAATAELESWISDQLRTGLNGFLADMHARCRRIASRLVDGKAAALASRLDELPARVFALPEAARADAALVEFSKLILLVRAWRAAPSQADVRRDVINSETRDEVLASPDSLRVRADWRVAGEEIETRRDGLVSHATWLDRVSGDADAPVFALLLDFYPASAGKRSGAFVQGERFAAEIVYYPSALPLRALIAERGPASANVASPSPPPTDPLQNWRTWLTAAPWTQTAPLHLPEGRIGLDAASRAWWKSADGRILLPLRTQPDELAFGLVLTRAVALWDGARLRLLSAETPSGDVTFDG